MMDRKKQDNCISRRGFLGGFAAAAGTALVSSKALAADKFQRSRMQVWSCGGLAEAFIPANEKYRQETGIQIDYTGAFAAALGKSLLGSATTEVFAGRVLGLAKKLKSAGKMQYFEPLCYTRYVMVTPKDNPALISDIRNMADKGVRVALSPGASPPGGKAVLGLLKKAGVLDQAMSNAVIKESCVQKTMQQVIDGKADVSVVEYRLTRMTQFLDKTHIIPIPEEFFPPPPLVFTIGVMKDAKDRELADHYVKFICSKEGQSYFEKAGFIPALSEKGLALTRKLGVKNV